MLLMEKNPKPGMVLKIDSPYQLVSRVCSINVVGAVGAGAGATHQ